jgi:hypothetical protein
MTAAHAKKFANHRELIFDQLDHRARIAKRIGSDGVAKPMVETLASWAYRGLRFRVRASDGAVLGTYADIGPVADVLTADTVRRRFVDQDLSAQYGFTPTVEQFQDAFVLLSRRVRAEHEELTVRESALTERRMAELEARRDGTAEQRARLAELRADIERELSDLDSEPESDEAARKRARRWTGR